MNCRCVFWLLFLITLSGIAGNQVARISLNEDGSQVSAYSAKPVISKDGTCIAFYSSGTQFGFSDTNSAAEIYLYDSTLDEFDRICVSTAGIQANNACEDASISNDGRYVTFYSYANNLVENDTNNKIDVFVRDRQTQTTQLVSISPNGEQIGKSTYGSSLSQISGNGRYVAFQAFGAELEDDTMLPWQVYRRDLQTQTTQLVSYADNEDLPNSESGICDISNDGRYIVFWSNSTNLTSDTDANGTTDLFVRDMDEGTTTCISLASGGSTANSATYVAAISGDGRYIAFESYASNLTGATDTADTTDIFRYDQQTDTIILISKDPSEVSDVALGRATNPDISDDGSLVFFTIRYAGDLSAADAFDGDQVYRVNAGTGAYTLVSAPYTGSGISNGYADRVSCSADGRFAAFASSATDLVENDTNGHYDIFVRDLRANQVPVAQPDSYSTPVNTLLSIPADGILANDSDPDGDTLDIVITGEPDHGDLTLNDDGSFTYMPDTDFFGEDTFSYKVEDLWDESTPATVTITVQPNWPLVIYKVKTSRKGLAGSFKKDALAGYLVCLLENEEDLSPTLLWLTGTESGEAVDVVMDVSDMVAATMEDEKGKMYQFIITIGEKESCLLYGKVKNTAYTSAKDLTSLASSLKGMNLHNEADSAAIGKSSLRFDKKVTFAANDAGYSAQEAIDNLRGE